MNLPRSAPTFLALLALLAVVVLLAPGIASLRATPCGLLPGHLWLAAFYAGITAWAVLALSVRVFRRGGNPVRRVALFGLLLGAFALAAFLPFGALVACYAMFGAFSGGADWALFNKYLGHFVSSAGSGYFWVVSLCLVSAAIALRPQLRLVRLHPA